jgi:very-short-patch-repair endonuclease
VSKVSKALSPGEEAFMLHCRAERLAPEREWRFHPTRKWRFDFAFPGEKLAIEVEGRRHLTYAGFIEDCDKYNTALKLGWRVLRYTPRMVTDGTAINDVLELLRS